MAEWGTRAVVVVDIDLAVVVIVVGIDAGSRPS
jgi:hypothetical protein